MRRILAKLAALFRRRGTESDLSREVAAHLTLLEDEFRAKGMNEEEARLAARRSYGNVELTKELHRDEWRFAWFEALVQDLRAAWRSLRKSPGFAATAIVTLALGIGANTAIFTMVNGVLLKKLPVADPERIVQIKATFSSGTGPSEMLAFNYPQYKQLRRQQTVFQDVIGVAQRLDTLDLDADQPHIKLDLVTGSFFSFFDTNPALGRLIEESDDEEGSELVCVLAYSAWQRLFRGDPAIVGRTIETDKVLMRVIGVAPSDFIGADLQKQTDVWAPTTAFVAPMPGVNRDSPGAQWLRLLGRLQEGATLDASSARLQDESPQIEQELPSRRVDRDAVYSLQDGSAGLGDWRGQLSSPLWILMAAVTLVLLVACANLANLLVARMYDRTQEFAVKLAVGIGRWRLARQLFVETLLVVFVGGIAALALASGLTRFVLAVFNEGKRPLPFALELPPDPTVLLYAGTACLLTAVLAGLYPAWRASRTGANLGQATNSARGLNHNWAGRSLILVQVALAVVLLFGSVLFTRSLRSLTTVDLGYSADRILSVQVSKIPFLGAKDNEPIELAELLARTRELPGVESAAYASIGVLEGNMMMTEFEVSRPDSETVTVNNVYALNVGPEYFETLQTPLLRGREFSESDLKDGPAVVIVNAALAKKAWPGEDPVGKRLGSRWTREAQVVGLVADSKYADVREDALPIAYRAFEKVDALGVTMQVRFRGSATALDGEIRDVIASAAPDFRIAKSATIESMRDSLISQDRLLAFLSSLFGLLGVGLALVGIYGLISYSVTQRTHEIGVRVSVGARRSQIVRLVLSEAAALVVLGIAVGVPAALLLSTWLESLLFEVTPSDPSHVAATLGILLLGGMAAAYLPALRATRIDPLQALKCD